MIEFLNKLKEKLKNEEMKQEETLPIPQEEMVALLKVLFTYYHGNRPCSAWEYISNAGNKENGGGDYAQLEKELLYLGYQIEQVIFEEKQYRLPIQQEIYEKRKQEGKFLPSDVKGFVIFNQQQKFVLSESPESLELLADAGDERAFWTRESFRRKGGCYIGPKQYKR